MLRERYECTLVLVERHHCLHGLLFDYNRLCGLQGSI
jgi:hypothetical protein